MNSLYDNIVAINNCKLDGIWFDKIEGYSCIGDVGSNAPMHPIQYRALTTVRPGDDDPFEGIGWTPSEAVRNLLKLLNQLEDTRHGQ